MPNQSKTPMHSFRCPDDVWARATNKARVRGETISDVLRRSVEKYANEEE